MRTQVSALEEEILGAELEAVEVCHSESPKLLVLSVVIELLEVGDAEARRVGDSSGAGVVFSLMRPLNQELPRENKSAEGTKQR